MPRRCFGEQRSAAHVLLLLPCTLAPATHMCCSACPAHLNRRFAVVARMRAGWHPFTPRLNRNAACLLGPTTPPCERRRGKARFALGQTEAAVADLEAAQRVEPGDGGIARELAAARRAAKQVLDWWKSARQWLRCMRFSVACTVTACPCLVQGAQAAGLSSNSALLPMCCRSARPKAGCSRASSRRTARPCTRSTRRQRRSSSSQRWTPQRWRPWMPCWRSWSGSSGLDPARCTARASSWHWQSACLPWCWRRLLASACAWGWTDCCPTPGYRSHRRRLRPAMQGRNDRRERTRMTVASLFLAGHPHS